MPLRVRHGPVAVAKPCSACNPCLSDRHGWLAKMGLGHRGPAALITVFTTAVASAHGPTIYCKTASLLTAPCRACCAVPTVVNRLTKWAQPKQSWPACHSVYSAVLLPIFPCRGQAYETDYQVSGLCDHDRALTIS